MSLRTTTTLPRVTRNTLLIVGNGLNRAVDNSGSWGRLLASLVQQSGYGRVLKTPLTQLSTHTNFVTLYQEIALYWMRRGWGDLELKHLVADAIHEFEQSVLENHGLHERIMALPCRDVCTTNYDYVLEESILDGAPLESCAASRSETTYSLYRCLAAGGKTVWHIHGEARVPRSINLGHNQYAGYLQYARQYLILGRDSSDRDRFPSLQDKLRGDAPFDRECWLDYFFDARRIVWLGISLPLPEYVLWWLIFYRAEKVQQFPEFYRGREMHYVDVYDPNESPDARWLREERNRMLFTAGAVIHPRPLRKPGGWRAAYEAVLAEFERS